jgi:acyl dehydratase
VTKVYAYDDFHVGLVLRSPRAITLDRARIISFGEEFDPQPAHLSEEAAARSQFGELVASGWHTASVSMRLTTETYRIADGGLGAGIEKMNWLRPVRPEDTLRVEITVQAMRPSRSRPDRGLITFHTRTLNQKGEAVMEMTSNVLAPRRKGEN